MIDDPKTPEDVHANTREAYAALMQQRAGWCVRVRELRTVSVLSELVDARLREAEEMVWYVEAGEGHALFWWGVTALEERLGVIERLLREGR